MNDNIKAGSDIHAGDGGYSLGTQEKYDEFVKGRNQSLGKMRIKELAEQAKGFVDLNQHVGGGKGCMVYTYDGLEKFAELIVRECADISDASFHNGSAGYLAILKHFGVEDV